jgi:hypothetical protein
MLVRLILLLNKIREALNMDLILKGPPMDLNQLLVIPGYHYNFVGPTAYV